jgi:pimeloyl-ACP methyl ester carboxylesterase
VDDFTTRDDGPLIGGRRAASGPPVLLLHGGPGLGFDYPLRSQPDAGHFIWAEAPGAVRAALRRLTDA